MALHRASVYHRIEQAIEQERNVLLRYFDGTVRSYRIVTLEIPFVRVVPLDMADAQPQVLALDRVVAVDWA